MELKSNIFPYISFCFEKLTNLFIIYILYTNLSEYTFGQYTYIISLAIIISFILNMGLPYAASLQISKNIKYTELYDTKLKKLIIGLLIPIILLNIICNIFTSSVFFINFILPLSISLIFIIDTFYIEYFRGLNKVSYQYFYRSILFPIIKISAIFVFIITDISFIIFIDFISLAIIIIIVSKTKIQNKYFNIKYENVSKYQYANWLNNILGICKTYIPYILISQANVNFVGDFRVYFSILLLIGTLSYFLSYKLKYNIINQNSTKIKAIIRIVIFTNIIVSVTFILINEVILTHVFKLTNFKNQYIHILEFVYILFLPIGLYAIINDSKNNPVINLYANIISLTSMFIFVLFNQININNIILSICILYSVNGLVIIAGNIKYVNFVYLHKISVIYIIFISISYYVLH